MLKSVQQPTKMKLLSIEIKNHGYSMKQIKRTDKVAIYYKCGGYEVVLIQKHNGYEIKGIKMEPAEYLPKDEDFGWKGWYYGGPNGRENAEKKFQKLTEIA